MQRASIRTVRGASAVLLTLSLIGTVAIEAPAAAGAKTYPYTLNSGQLAIGFASDGSIQ
ncbi:hypothetical protein [Leifsonia xyli]|uniref:hypothetical protein n=1 Tax=Leifsonia xyli TaxID=1575 RepID=UPI000A576807|nr:hypothetical protein [Leifsonia xyli]